MSSQDVSPSPRLTHRLIVTGRVQGVGFRMYMAREAQTAGVNGWVRNRRDGTVEAVVKIVKAKPGDSLAVDAVIMEFA